MGKFKQMSIDMSFDERMELEAVQAGLNFNPVFPAGKEWLRKSRLKLQADLQKLQVLDASAPKFTLDTPVQSAPKQNNLPHIWDLVIVDMSNRDKVGAKKYGTHLQPFNGRDVLQDAYEEALDLCVYLRQAIYERDKE